MNAPASVKHGPASLPSRREARALRYLAESVVPQRCDDYLGIATALVEKGWAVESPFYPGHYVITALFGRPALARFDELELARRVARAERGPRGPRTPSVA